jgi:magnesium transporter
MKITIPKLFPFTSRSKAGLPPGSIQYTGEALEQPVTITVTDYNQDTIAVASVDSIAGIPKQSASTRRWIHITGLQNAEVIKAIGDRYHLHPLLLEDVVHTYQRPKIEEYETCLFVVLKELEAVFAANSLAISQTSLVIGDHYVLSFSERPSPAVAIIEKRIEQHKGRICSEGIDYLAYALVDAVIDSYFSVLEDFSTVIESLEPRLLEKPHPELLQLLYTYKKLLISMRKTFWPLREVISILSRSETVFITKNTQLYMRDIYDHTIHILDTVETLRDVVSGLFDLYLSSVSNRMNEVMKVLTIIATIFIPITFIAGIYGMNFKFMPELDWPYGYFCVLGVMFSIIIFMLLWFKRKGWL